MNNKKFAGLAAILCFLLAGSALLTACTPAKESEETTEAPTEAITQTPTEAPTEEPTEAPTEAAVEVDCTISVMDQDDATMGGLHFTLTAKEGLSSHTLTTNDQGQCTAKLAVGTYTIGMGELPEGYLMGDKELVVTADSKALTIRVDNNIPNGTQNRPFVIVDETTTITLPAGASHVYVTYGAMDRSFVMTNAKVKVSYRDKEYAPDAEGLVKFPLVSDGPRDPAYITLTNTTGADLEVTFSLEAIPGTLNNPFVVDQLGEALTASVPKEKTVYYKWTSDKQGILMVSSETSNNHITMTNLTTSVNSYYTNGTSCEYLAVKMGDEVSIAVASRDSSLEVAEVSFTLNAYAGTAEDPIPAGKEEIIVALDGGEATTYSYNGSASTVTLKGKGFSMIVGETEYTPDESGAVKVTFPADAESVSFTVKNNGEGHGECTLTFAGEAETETAA